MAHCKSFRTGLDSGRNCAERLVQPWHAGDGCQRPLVPRSRCPPRLRPSVSAPSKAWRFLQGGSPCQGRARHPPVPRVAHGEEERKPRTNQVKRPQGTLEAGRVTAHPEVWDSLVKAIKADGDGFHAPEAQTKASVGREAGGSVGVRRAWHAEREALRTWEIPGTPGDRQTHPTTRRAVDGPWEVGSPRSTRRTGEPSTGGRG